MEQFGFKRANLIVLFISILMLVVTTSTTKAQTNMTWAFPQTIPGLKDSGLYPVLVADNYGRLHVFNSQQSGENLSIYYTGWQPDRGWVNFVDILRAPRGDARVYGAHIDQQDEMHLLFFGGDDLGANMYYTKAPVEDIAKSTEWKTPELIGEAAITPSTADLVGDKNGFLLAVYSGNLRGNGLYATQSLDGGQTWNSPKPIYLTNNDNLWPTALNLYIDDQGKVFSIWSVVDETGNGQAIYFASLDENHQQWTPAKSVVTAINWEADTPAIIKHNSKLIIIYHNGLPTTRWMKTSLDEGETWSEPIRLFEHVGSNGAASMAIDSGNNLHMVFGNRIDSLTINGAWHSRWLGQQWSQADPIISGPRILVGPNGEEGFDPSFLQSVIMQGNLFFIVWRHDPGAGPTNIWYTHKILETPKEPPLPLPTTAQENATPPPSPTVEPSLNPTSTPFHSETTVEFNQEKITVGSQRNNNSASTFIILGILPVALILVVIVIINLQRK